jgi:hypothetical protein
MDAITPMDGMTHLPNLDWLDDIERGDIVDEPEPSEPNDATTNARCLLPLLSIPGVTTADRLEPVGGLRLGGAMP